MQLQAEGRVAIYNLPTTLLPPLDDDRERIFQSTTSSDANRVDENARNNTRASIMDKRGTMTRLIVDASGALSASTGIRWLWDGPVAEWSGTGRGDMVLVRWSERKSPGVCANRSILPPRVDILLSLSLSLSIHSSRKNLLVDLSYPLSSSSYLFSHSSRFLHFSIFSHVRDLNK